MKQKFFLTALLALSGVLTFGQNKLDTTEISATRILVPEETSGKSTTIVSREEIELLPVNTVEELLQYVAGVNLNSRGGFGVQTDIGLRGSTFSQVLVLLDNQRLNDPLTGHFNNNIPIALSEIERIEVIRGSGSVAFGSDAVGGMIHIKTKAYTAQKKLRFNFAGKVARGEYGLRNNDLGIFVGTKKYAVSGGLKSLKSDGQSFVNPNYTQNPVGDSLYNTDFNLRNYTLAGTYFYNKWKFCARGALDYRDLNAKYFYTTSTFDESREKVSAYWFQGAAIFKNDKQRTEFNIGHKTNRDSFDFLPGVITANGHVTSRLNATITQQRKIKGLDVAYGGQFDYSTIESNDRGDHTNQSTAVFAEARHNYNNMIYTNLGVRGEHNSIYGTSVVPQLTIAWLRGNYTLRSSIGQSIRNPDFTERFVSYNIPQLSPGRNAGNPDLKRETATNIDFNLTYRERKKTSMSIGVFARQSNNLIDFVRTNSNNINNLTNLVADTNYFYAQNISKSLTTGIEFSGKYDFVKNDSIELITMVDATYLNTTNSDGSAVSKYIANHPVFVVNPRIIAMYKKFRLSVTASYIQRNPFDITSPIGEAPNEYLVLNARVSFKPPVFPARIFVEGRNLTDMNYQEILGAQMPGRWLYGGFVWRWGEVKL